MSIHTLKQSIRRLNSSVKVLSAVFIFTGLAAGAYLALTPKQAAAACTTTSNAPYGYVSYTVNITQSGTYRVASRLMVPNGTDNSYTLDVGTNCGIKVGGSSAIPANSWTWVDYRDGNSASKVDLNLSAGTYTVNLVGTSPSVKIARVLLMSDVNCAVSGNGDNCYVAPDTTPPTVSVTAPTSGSTVNGTVAVSANASDNAAVSKVDFYYGGNRTLLGSDSSSPYSISWNSASVTDGPYSITAVATDSSGNTTTSNSVPITVKNAVTPPPDTTPPSSPQSVKAVMASGTTSPQANLSWTASTDNTAVTGYDVYKNGKLLKTVTTSATTDAGLTIGQTYSYYVIAKDAAGNSSAQSNTASVTVPDTVIPTVSLTAPVSGAQVSGTTTVTATAADNVGVTKVEYLVDGVVQSPADTSAPYSFSWDTTQVSGGSHTVAVQSTDAAGNVSLLDSATVTVQNNDVTPPTAPSNVKATATAYNKVVVTWTASTDAGGIKDYVISRDGVWLGLTGNTTTYTDTTAMASTTYQYSLFAIDNASNPSDASNVATVTTPAAPDTEAPTAPGNLSATVVGSTQINLTWDASSDNVGVKQYQVFRGSTQIATVSTTSFGDTGLAAGGYSYSVKAVDAAGNTSPASNTATATIVSTVDTDLALNKNATVSSIENSNYVAGKAVDGDSTTRWASALKPNEAGGSDPEWIYVDLGNSYTINEVVLNWQTAYGKAYQVQVSNDATNWTTIYSTTTGAGGVDDLTGLYGTGRYVRMYGTARGTKWGYSLFDLKVYGTSASTNPPITTGTLTGVVVDSNSGVPLGATYVSVFYNGARHTVRTAKSDGKYTLSSIPAGTYSFKYVRDRYQTQYANSAVAANTIQSKNIQLVSK